MLPAPHNGLLRFARNDGGTLILDLRKIRHRAHRRENREATGEATLIHANRKTLLPSRDRLTLEFNATTLTRLR
jgi:hypothetical protein